MNRGGGGGGALVGQWYQEEESSYESKSQLLIHAHRGELAKISRGKVEQFGWLVGAG